MDKKQGATRLGVILLAGMLPAIVESVLNNGQQV